ncbi:MAG: hypothetical protein KGS48_18840 [Bacteroidetes bacterium]|nr:hypothetical protein [Bacteroidota bacterium]
MSTTENAEKSNAEQLFDQVVQHLDTRWEYYSILAAEKSAELVSSVVRALVVAVLALQILFFFSIGFAFWLGEWMGSTAGGFALAGLLFVPLALLAYLVLKPMVRSRIIEAFLRNGLDQNKKGSA